MEEKEFSCLDSPLGWKEEQKTPTTTTPQYQLTTHKEIIPPKQKKTFDLEGHFLGGYPLDSSGLRMFGLVDRLPINFLSNRLPGNFLYNVDDLRGKLDVPEPRRRKRRAFRRKRDNPTTEAGVTSTRGRVTKRKPSTTTGRTPEKQYVDGDSESALRREIARMNLDVLQRLSTMLGEEREKYAAERQMLSASRDMMRAETRKVISERFKLDSERQKVDLERDMLQSQVLARRLRRRSPVRGAAPAPGEAQSDSN